jgi:hypothetical protein
VRLAALWVVAAAISGFTLRRYLGPLDEGILLQAAARMAHGQWPWRDFGWAYGPGQPLFVRVFGDSLLSWRVLRVAADATAAVLVYALVRDVRPRWALWAWLAAAVTAAQPTSANPTAQSLAFALGAAYSATRGRPALAGVLAALAAFWRPDVGVLAALTAAAICIWGQRRAGESGAAVRGEAAGAAGEAVRGEAAGAAGEAVRGEAAGAAGEAARGEAGGEAARRARVRAASAVLGVAAGAGLVLYAPFLVAAGPVTVWDALVIQATRDGEWWRLPFPDGFPGGDAKDFVAWLLPYAAIVVLALSIRRPLAILGAGALLYFTSRADLEHAQALLVVTAALAALVKPKPVGVVVLAMLIAVGGANRASALLKPPDLQPFESVRVPPEEAQSLPKLIAKIHALVPNASEPIYVAPLRSDLVTFSNPLLYVLVDRPNALRRDFLLQAKPQEQRRIIAKLPRVVIRWTNPDSARAEPNRRGRPSGSTALSDYLAAHYSRVAVYGDYEVLSRSSASR